MKSRKGKIARLPEDIRLQLNSQLRNGEDGPTLLRWLNSLPEVQAVLAKKFNGEPIKRQNLSAWRKGGYRDWKLLRKSSSLAPPARPQDNPKPNPAQAKARYAI